MLYYVCLLFNDLFIKGIFVWDILRSYDNFLKIDI